jgi:type I restriction-modification system DNA methylase subunit
MRKSLGEKRKEISPDQIAEITRVYGAFEENDRVKLWRWRMTWMGLARMLAGMSEHAENPVVPPIKSPEELAEIRAVLEQVRRGDYSGTIPWEEIAKEFDPPSARGS